jgi:hypothetical protein
MSNNYAGVSDDCDLGARHLAAIEERSRLHRGIVAIVDCIRQMRLEGLADNEIVGLFRHATDELDQATPTQDAAPVHSDDNKNQCEVVE